jgi:hypothetical protein
MKWRSSIVVGAILAGSLAVGMPAASADNLGNEGCTPGYWKNHTSNWEEYHTAWKLKFIPLAFPPELAAYGENTFLEALNFKGGSGVEGAARILLRATAAAFLNAAHEGVAYPYRRFALPGDLQSQVNAALASLDRDTMLTLAAQLDAANNLGCPL